MCNVHLTSESQPGVFSLICRTWPAFSFFNAHFVSLLQTCKNMRSPVCACTYSAPYLFRTNIDDSFLRSSSSCIFVHFATCEGHYNSNLQTFYSALLLLLYFTCACLKMILRVLLTAARGKKSPRKLLTVQILSVRKQNGRYDNTKKNSKPTFFPLIKKHRASPCFPADIFQVRD